MSERGPAIDVAFYSPANLNLLDGSSIWVQAVAEVLHAGPNVRITLPLKAAERRTVVTGLLRRLDRVRLVDPISVGYSDLWGLRNEDALDAIESIDRHTRFDVVLLRSYELCRLAVERPQLRGRLWSAYVIEPERDLRSTEYRDGLARIADGSRYVAVQSEEMRALAESVIPGSAGKVILLPPAIADASVRADPSVVVPRLLYTGKFSRLYPVSFMLEVFAELRRAEPRLEFHVAGDKFHVEPGDGSALGRLERQLTRTPGVAWHGGIDRDAVERLLAQGGIGLNLWDERYDVPLNNLVISTKTLDYCAVGLPVVLNRTASHEAMLGPDYPLFITALDEVPELLARLLADADLYRTAAERTWSASRAYTYREVYQRLEPYLSGADASAAERETYRRPKLEAASLNLGVAASDPGTLESALDVLRELRRHDDRYRLLVHGSDGDGALTTLGRAERAAVTLDQAPPGGAASWLRKVAFLVVTGADDKLALVRASGTVTVRIGDEAAAGDGRALAFGSAEEAAGEIVRLVESGAWRSGVQAQP